MKSRKYRRVRGSLTAKRVNRKKTTKTPVAKSRSRGRPKKLKPLNILPVQGRKKVYCGDLAYLPSDEYERAGTRRECLDKGYGAGRASEYNYLRERLQETGYLLPERSYNRSTKKDDYEIV